MIKKLELVTFKIVPDRTVTNRRSQDLMRAVHDFSQSIMARISFKEKKIQQKMRFFWDIVMTAEDVAFFCTVPKEKATFVKQQLELTWERSSVTEEEITLPETPQACCEVGMTRHNIFSLKVDRRVESEPLGSLLIGTKELKEDDWARIQIMIDPIPRIGWQDQAEKYHQTFKKGKTPKRMRINKKDAVLAAGDAFCFVMDQVSEAIDTVMDVAAGEASARDKELRKKFKPDDDMEKRMILIDGSGLSAPTHKKKSAPTFKTWIRIVTGSQDKGRRESLINTLSNSFHDLSGDNELERRDLSKKTQERIIKEIRDFSPSIQTLADPDIMILSNMELGRLVELPSAQLQDQFNFNTIKRREMQVPEKLKEGIPWGVVSHKGMEEIIHLPTHNYGLLCRPQVILGKMGTGKSTLGSRLGHLFPEHGFTSILMDTADGSLIDEARDALPADFPESHIIDLDFGNLMELPASDWNEMTAAMNLNGDDWDRVSVERRKAANRLTSILIHFIDQLATHETTDRMERYLAAVGKVILSSPDRGIMEVIMCLTNEPYRDKVLKTFKITDPILYSTIEELHEMTKESRDQIVKSIMSRLNILLSDDYLRNSILQTPQKGADGKPLINVRKWIDGNPETNPKYGGAYFIGIRMPKSEMMDQAVDRLATFWDAKIWLAALSRYDLPKVKGCHGKPFVYIRDEPHQTPSSYVIHQDACREARKWGMKNIWLAHKMEDFDFMKKTLKDAGAQFSMFSTSKETVRSLKEELHPFSEEELQQIPEQFWAVNKFAEHDQAFICKTLPAKKIVDRSHLRAVCSKKYGRPLREVEQEIHEKTKLLYNSNVKGNTNKKGR
jgi:hypothetical protein